MAEENNNLDSNTNSIEENLEYDNLQQPPSISNINEISYNNRCHYITEDFRFCNRRRMATQRFCFNHYMERRFEYRRNREDADYAPLPNRRNLDNQEESKEDESKQDNDNDENLSVNPENNLSVIPQNVEDNEIQGVENENINLVPEELPPLIRSNAIVFDNNINRVVDNIINETSFSSIVRRRGILSRARNMMVPVQENKEENYCLLCENYVVKPSVELRCNHKYHLNCFIIDNSNGKNQIELKEKCNKCDKKIIYEQEEYDCSICLEKIVDHKILSNLPCEHKFHLHCIEQWKVMNKNTCPLCRKEF